MDNPVPPSQEDIQDLLIQGQELLEKLVHYRSEASRIDNQVIDSTDDYVPLDDLPGTSKNRRFRPITGGDCLQFSDLPIF